MGTDEFNAGEQPHDGLAYLAISRYGNQDKFRSDGPLGTNAAFT